MRLFKITNPKYTGEIEVLFNNGSMVKLDFANAVIDDDIKYSFKRVVPVVLENFLQGKWCSNDTIIVEGAFNVELKDFTRNYPYQRNMHLLPPIWDKMPMADKIIAVQAATPYRKFCDKNKNWYTPKIAASWLKNKEYLNDWNKM